MNIKKEQLIYNRVIKEIKEKVYKEERNITPEKELKSYGFLLQKPDGSNTIWFRKKYKEDSIRNLFFYLDIEKNKIDAFSSSWYFKGATETMVLSAKLLKIINEFIEYYNNSNNKKWKKNFF